MEKNLIEKYQDFQQQLRTLFKEINRLQADNARLSKENMELRHEVSLLRLYVDMHVDESKQGDLLDLDIDEPLNAEALDFFQALPASFNFSKLFQLSEMMNIELEVVKDYLRLYLHHGMVRQQGSRIEKPGHRPPGALSIMQQRTSESRPR